MMNFLRKTFLWILLLPVVTFGLGAASNQLVLIVNHDKFPVLENSSTVQKIELNRMVAYDTDLKIANDPHTKSEDRISALKDAETLRIMSDEGMIDSVHCLMTPRTHLNALADIFDFQDGTYSVGDGLLYLGMWLASFCPFVWGFAVINKIRKI